MKIDSSLAAVVTGDASSLGLTTVKALRAAGASVAIFDLSEENGTKAAAETGSVFCPCDVLSDESVDKAFAKAREAIRIATIQSGIFATPAMMRHPEEYASLALEIIRNGYINGETLRLDGAIRMPPR